MKLGVCVPYRNREEHLHTFVPKVGKYLKEQGIDFHIYFCHQDDSKLFNRGATKNIAAKHAFEEGCDYIVWHDIDMIPDVDGGADYSYPQDNPRHIATQISQMEYQLKYHEYFGGAVVFTKEQVEKTNGYSNEYWDWGMEDDDLFWRCHKEGYTNDTYLKSDLDQSYYSFNGVDSYIKIPFSRNTRGLTSKSHTISVLTRPFQQPDKNPIFLIGDKNNQYVEYPILRIPGYDYGLSFNNSRALSLTYWNTFNNHNYMWIKRYDNQWSWVTAVFDAENRQTHFYLNGTEVDSKAGHGSNSPLQYTGKLKSYGQQDIYLGSTPSLPDDCTFKFFKGDIAKVYAWKEKLTPEQVSNLHNDIPSTDLVVDLDFNTPNTDYLNLGTVKHNDLINIPNSILPYRVEGRFTCLPHVDEGLVDGKWSKGDTTAKNEERYVLQMQQGNIDHKKDGIKQVKYTLKSETILTPWAKVLNIEL
jgi:hypothetical protein